MWLICAAETSKVSESLGRRRLRAATHHSHMNHPTRGGVPQVLSRNMLSVFWATYGHIVCMYCVGHLLCAQASGWRQRQPPRCIGTVTEPTEADCRRPYSCTDVLHCPRRGHRKQLRKYRGALRRPWRTKPANCCLRTQETEFCCLCHVNTSFESLGAGVA